MKNVLFRADAFPGIGTGDLISLINLSEYFTNAGWQAFFCVRDHEAAKKIVDKRGLQNVTWIDKEASLEDEITKVNELLIDKAIAASFYEITNGSIKDHIGLTRSPIMAAVSFDGRIPDDLDIVIDWDAAALSFFKPEEMLDTTFFLGPEYVLLSRTFLDRSARASSRNSPPKNVLISMGGVDEKDLTSRIVDTILRSDLNVRMTVIAGAGFVGVDKLSDKFSGTKHRIKINVADMLHEYLECDVAVAAGGLISSELAVSSTPAILIATHEHQVARCEYFQDQGWARYLGLLEFDDEALVKALKDPILPARPFQLKVENIIQRTEEIYAKHYS